MYQDKQNIAVVYTNHRAFEAHMINLCENFDVKKVARGVRTTTITTQIAQRAEQVCVYRHIFLRTEGDLRTAEEMSAGIHFQGIYYITGNYSSHVINYLQSRIRTEQEVVRRCLI